MQSKYCHRRSLILYPGQIPQINVNDKESGTGICGIKGSCFQLTLEKNDSTVRDERLAAVSSPSYEGEE